MPIEETQPVARATSENFSDIHAVAYVTEDGEFYIGGEIDDDDDPNTTHHIRARVSSEDALTFALHIVAACMDLRKTEANDG